MFVDKTQIAIAARFTYCADMGNLAFRDRVPAEMTARGWNKAELSRRSAVPYHTLDKFLKGTSVSTSAENATKLARALGIKVDDDAGADELRVLYFDVPEEQREALLATVRALVRGMREDS